MQQLDPNKNLGDNTTEGIQIKFQGPSDPQLQQSNEVLWALSCAADTVSLPWANSSKTILSYHI